MGGSGGGRWMVVGWVRVSRGEGGRMDGDGVGWVVVGCGWWSGAEWCD